MVADSEVPKPIRLRVPSRRFAVKIPDPGFTGRRDPILFKPIHHGLHGSTRIEAIAMSEDRAFRTRFLAEHPKLPKF